MVLMRAFLMLYGSNFETDDTDDGRRRLCGKSRSSERRAFTVLSSVCWNWHLTLTGWPDSPTGHWVRHQLRKMVLCKCVMLAVQGRMLDLHRVSENVPPLACYNFDAREWILIFFWQECCR